MVAIDHKRHPQAESSGVKEIATRSAHRSTLLLRLQRHFPEAASGCFCRYSNDVKIGLDPVKRDRTPAERGLDFADAAIVFAGVTVEIEDTRQNDGDTRIVCYGLLEGRMVVVGYTPRGADRHIFSMRKANEREQARIAPLLEV